MKAIYKIIELIDIDGVILKPHKPLRMSYRVNDIESTRHDPIHLYLISNDEIKEGDWYCNLDMKTSEHSLVKADSERLSELATNAPSCKKIVASTDPKLIEYCKGVHRLGEGCNLTETCDYPNCRPLKFSESFIKNYVEADGDIDQVLVEVEQSVCNSGSGGCYGTGKFYPVPDENGAVITSDILPLSKTFFSHEAPKIGDRVMVFLHDGNPRHVFEVISGILTRLDDDYPSGSINGEEIDFASEGHSSFIRVIKGD